MNWRVAQSLDILLGQVNTLAPNRDKSSDGSIGDPNHSARESDHNPDFDGIVKARDFTNDPAHGMSSQALADALVASKDERIKYVISNRRICSGTGQDHPAWVWWPYPVPPNKNPHNHHVHVSVKKEAKYYDSRAPWEIALLAPAPDTSVPVVPPMPHQVLRRGMTGPDVGHLQALLKLTVDGNFGPATESALKEFQKAKGLTADGVAGRYTWEVLETSKT